jgi:chemosensory pili system protein ChpA (sensor histidine kinase/response regulator)
MGVDPDIAEVFIEEANEVMEELNTLIPQWKSNQDNNTLATIRRHYHTLKGSGRMAGADVIGELSWSVEESLNRVTDGNIASSPELEQLLTNSHQLIPELLTRFIHGNTSSVATVTELIDLAKQILNPAVEIEVLEPIDTGPVVPELLQAFSDEAMQHLNTFKINLAEATSPFPIDKTLLQASHSLKACANEAQVYAVANVSNTLDNYLQTFYNNDITLNEAQLGKLNESIEGLTLLVDDATASRNNEQHVYDLLSKLNDMRPDLQLSEDQQRIIPESVAPEPVALETVDTATLVPEPINTEPEVPTLLQVFNDEAMQHLNTFKISLAEATSPFPIDKTLLQASHSLKACANEAQVYVVANVSTTLDNYLQTFYNNDITLNEAQLGKLNESIEGLTLLVDDATASRNNEQHVYDLLNKLNDMRPDLQLSEDQQGNIPEPAALEPVDDEPDVPDHVDTELLQIFSDEAMQHLNTFKATLAEATWPFRLDKTLLQASHSLKGCANVAQVYAVANVATTLDTNLHNFYNNGITLNETQLGKLNETIEGLTLLVDDAAASRNNEQQVYDLLSKLNDIQPGTQLAGVQQRIDPEILTAFLEETAELFEQYELLRQQLSQLPDDPDYKTALQQTLLKLDENADHAELPLLTELYQSLMQLTAEPDISENALSTLIDMGSVQFTNIIESLVKNQDLPDISDFKGSVSTYFEQVETNISEQANDAIELEADPDSVHSYMPEADEELLEAFTEECAELLESSGLAIKQWQKDPSNNEAAQQIQRDLHTLKGGARLTAITPLADLTHHTESLTLMASDNKCETDAEFFNLLQRCQDRLADMQEQFSRRSDIMLADDLITEIHHFSTQRDPESTAVDITQLIPTVSPPVENETTSSKTKSSSGGEQVRVKADLLDFLTNFAGEVSISRDRVSQQNTAMRQQLTEMESTVERLQEQLRKLEMETEAQILFRYEDQALQGRSEFDPLELDRFSQMQQLSRGLTESVTDLHDITHSIEDLVRESDTILLQQSRLSTDIQQGLMNTRLLPFNGLVPRLERIVRQTNTELDKQSELVVYGADRELDRTILDHIVAPIEHILRNAISHGIESQQERQQSEKNDVAQLTLTITRDGSEILITLSDDGRGIDVEKIRQKALANNLINPDKMPSDEELIQLILHSGFSTADDISQLAGRGVGMDVVNSEIRTLKGRLSIQSVKGQGTSFNIRLPLTLSVMQALLVGCAEEQYAIPLASVHAGERIAIKDIKTLLAQGDEARYEFNGVDYQFMALATLLNQPFNLQDDHAPQLPLLLFNSGEMQVALLVDSINSSREIVLKSVGEQLGHIAAINGATILGDGHVVFVLDIPTLVNTVDETMAADNLLDSALSTLHSIQNRLPLAMVVDDSITMRKASGNLLKRHGFEVITARDGIDAVALLNEQIPDVILLDVEMPRMDGFEFATLVRNDEQFSHLPIIMITSRTGEKHRSRARAIGVDAYLGKPYQEGELVDRLQSILGNKYPNPD